jgi:hypothetical protein
MEMDRVFQRGDKLFLTDTGEPVVFSAYAELSEYAYIESDDMGEMLVHLEDLMPAHEPVDILSVDPEPEQIALVSHPAPIAGKLELGIQRIGQPGFEDPEIEWWLLNGLDADIQWNAEIYVHGLPKQRLTLRVMPGNSSRLPGIAKTDLGSGTYLLADLLLGETLFFSGKKIRLPVQRMVKESVDREWLRVVVYEKANNPKITLKEKQLIKQPNLVVKTAHRVKKPSLSNEVMHRASFPTSIDLHLESLRAAGKTPGGKHIIQFQVYEAERYLAEAFRADIKEVYLIHGIGEGKLRERLHQVIRHMSDVVYFANEYHPRFGWGATVVRFR